MQTYQDILVAAQSLAAAEKVQLIGALWSTVAPEDWAKPSEAWIVEVQSRSQDLDEGIESTSSWSEVRERARRKAGLDG